ncbi:hypothetical protein ACR79P_08385 [Sphingobacterium spiritivorum]|uniref:hypothetical protein n=1 Tax=Sphingobacterium spiritivorum TaxID=258 RepID=UPI003DA3D0E6
MKKEVEKPPIGVVPDYIWKEQRIKELSAAIARFLESSYFIISESWIKEYNSLIQERNERDAFINKKASEAHKLINSDYAITSNI